MPLPDYLGRVLIDGHKIEIQPGENTTTYDIPYAYGTQLIGAYCFTDDTKYGDKLDMTVRHPAAGEVYRFGNNVYLPEALPGGRVSPNILMQTDGAEVPTGLFYRVEYTAVDTNGRKLILWLVVRR